MPSPSLMRGLLAAMVLALASGPWPDVRAAGPPPAAEPSAEAGSKPEKAPESSPEEKMARRFPQPVKVDLLVGAPVVDMEDRVIGRVRGVTRTADGKLRLITAYGGVFGLGARAIAVPIEVVALIGRSVATLDWPIDRFELAPTWYGSDSETALDRAETIRIAIARR